VSGHSGPGPGGWYYVIRVSPEGRPDPETGPDGPMTLAEALTRETPPDPVSGWRSIAVGAITATG